MKRLIKNVALFLLPIIALMSGGECFMRSLPNMYKYKTQWMDTHKEHVAAIILGDSKSFEGINPALFHCNAFNLAQPAQLLEYDCFLAYKYIPQCPRLKYVILPISSNLLYADMENGIHATRCTYYKIYMGYDKHSFFSQYNWELSNLNACKQKYDAYKIAARNGTGLQCDSRGFGPEKLSTKKVTWNQFGLHNLELKPNAMHVAKQHISENISYLNRIADICAKHNVTLVLVTMPQWKAYTHRINRDFVKYVTQTGRIFSERPNVIYFNYLTDSRFTADNFIDNCHLSDVGANKFTQILIHDIEK